MRTTLIIILLAAYNLKGQDTATISHLEKSANAKGYAAITGVIAGVFSYLSVKDDQHRATATAFSLATIGLHLYAWIEFKQAGKQQTKADKSAGK